MTDYSLTLNKRNDIVRKKDILFICMKTIRKDEKKKKTQDEEEEKEKGKEENNHWIFIQENE